MKEKIINYFKKNYLAFVLIILLTIIDQVLKYLVKSNMQLNEEIPVIKNLFSLIYVLNEGAAFGILQGRTIFLILITFIAFFVFGYLAKDFDFKNNKIYTISLIMVISGTFGNFIDRIFNKGLVVDYIATKFINFPVFNFADSLLTVGIILLFIQLVFLDKKKENDENNSK